MPEKNSSKSLSMNSLMNWGRHEHNGHNRHWYFRSHRDYAYLWDKKLVSKINDATSESVPASFNYCRNHDSCNPSPFCFHVTSPSRPGHLSEKLQLAVASNCRSSGRNIYLLA